MIGVGIAVPPAQLVAGTPAAPPERLEPLACRHQRIVARSNPATIRHGLMLTPTLDATMRRMHQNDGGLAAAREEHTPGNRCRRGTFVVAPQFVKK
jgi:hypothetical protein